ncbi:hypothetical protein CLAIMM_12888 isoform 1 [Cladophialophora immunda]|nr:hypothetical protein CLAIMM_12888 isoform 1 [Cladophialophora immunda]
MRTIRVSRASVRDLTSLSNPPRARNAPASLQSPEHTSPQGETSWPYKKVGDKVGQGSAQYDADQPLSMGSMDPGRKRTTSNLDELSHTRRVSRSGARILLPRALHPSAAIRRSPWDVGC